MIGPKLDVRCQMPDVDAVCSAGHLRKTPANRANKVKSVSEDQCLQSASKVLPNPSSIRPFSRVHIDPAAAAAVGRGGGRLPHLLGQIFVSVPAALFLICPSQEIFVNLIFIINNFASKGIFS